jgi:hypothetical protein
LCAWSSAARICTEYFSAASNPQLADEHSIIHPGDVLNIPQG